MRTSADSWQPQGASLESCCSASSAHGTARTEAQRLGLLACLATSNFKRNLVCTVLGGSDSLATKMRKSVDSWQPEGASLESCCSASSAHGTARTEAQRLGLLACLATSNFKRTLGIGGGPCQASFPLLVRKCERLQMSGSQKGLAWKAVAQPYLPMALLAQRHRDWDCLIAFPPQTSNVAWEFGGLPARLLSQPCSENVNVCRYLAARGG